MDWRIFFIGPMSGSHAQQQHGSRPTDASAPSNDHFSVMVAAVAEELRDHGYRSEHVSEHRLTGGTAVPSLVMTRDADHDQVTLIEPHELFGPGSIPENVFDAIDDADLVIADLSGSRPAVIYEIALAHALGIWTLLLSSEADAGHMFYLHSYRHVLVDFYEGALRSDDFRTALEAWLTQRDKRFDSSNPFTDFYGAPIPDISAASGLANGYYDNFVSRVLALGAEIVDRRDPGDERRAPVSGLLVVRPPNLGELLDHIDDTSDALQRAFGDRFRRGERGAVYVDTKGHGDRTCEFLVDDWLIDVPRTVLSLERSPRLRRTMILEERLHAHDHLSGVLIERFLEGTRRALESERDIKKKKERFFYGSPDEIVRFLEAPPGLRPTVW